MMKLNVSIFFILFGWYNLLAQDQLESLLGPSQEDVVIINTFKSTRIVNNHSIEIFNPTQLDLRISHRFGLLNSGFYELFGLDQAKIRVGLEYGLMNNCMIGFGRSTFNKSYDGYFKYVLLKQKKGIKRNPITIVSLSTFNFNSLKKSQPKYPLLGRFSYANQLMMASKINSQLSIQLMPTFIHWNMVESDDELNTIFVVGAGFRYLITKSISINSEYFYRVLNSTTNYFNSFSIGLDIETGGHVFQLHLTNSIAMDEAAFMSRTVSSWSEGGIHFGFNISREFNL